MYIGHCQAGIGPAPKDTGSESAVEMEDKMTMHLTTSYIGDYRADRAKLAAEMGKLASEFGLAAIGREYPRHIIRGNGYRYVRAGKWYAELADGSRRALTAKERAAKSRVDMSALSTYGSERFEARDVS